MNSLQLQYLQAIGLEVWHRREPSAKGAASELPVAAAPASDASKPHTSRTGVSSAKASTPSVPGPEVSRADVSNSDGPRAGESVAPQVPATAAGARLKLQLGPGDGACLMVCTRQAQTAGTLAADLSRLTGSQAVWAWPGSNGPETSLSEAVEARLFTQVVVFGEALAADLGIENSASMMGSARLVVVRDLEKLERDAEARKACWNAFRAGGLTLRA